MRAHFEAGCFVQGNHGINSSSVLTSVDRSAAAAPGPPSARPEEHRIFSIHTCTHTLQLKVLLRIQDCWVSVFMIVSIVSNIILGNSMCSWCNA